MLAQETMTDETPVCRQSMRAFLSALEGRWSARFDLAVGEVGFRDCCVPIRIRRCLRFERVEGDAGSTKMSIVGNLLNSMPRFAIGMSSTTGEIQTSLLAAIEKPLPHRVVATAPCQEEIIDNPSLAEELPIPRFFEKEGGPYITAGVIIAKDRVSGDTNLSIARLMPLGANRAFVGIAPNHHLAVLGRAAHARGEKLNIAVCIGNHPTVLLAACLTLVWARTSFQWRVRFWGSRSRWSAPRNQT